MVVVVVDADWSIKRVVSRARVGARDGQHRRSHNLPPRYILSLYIRLSKSIFPHHPSLTSPLFLIPYISLSQLL